MPSKILVVRLVSRTYDDVVDYVIRELEIRPVYHQGTVQRFLGLIFFYANEAEITDTLSTDDEMPQISVAMTNIK